MNDNKIIIELKPVIYAHHHGYRVVAKAHNISPAIVDALVASNHHLYFTNRKLDEHVRPLKFRFFPLEIEANERKEKCYVLARLESHQDVITHRGLVSATQFYVIDGPNCKIFEKELQANAALLMAKIRFPNFNLEKLARNDVVTLDPIQPDQLDADAADKELQKLPSSSTLPKLRALFTADFFKELEGRKKIFVYSKEFTDATAIFNLYCRVFFTAQLEYYRQSCAFSTGELTTDITDYNLVFLHAGVGDKPTVKGADSKIIFLDNPETGKSALWYLEEEKLPEYYRLLSKRISKPSYKTIQILKPYCHFLLNRKESVAMGDFTYQVAGFLNSGNVAETDEVLKALNIAAIGNDLLNALALFKISEKTLELLRSHGGSDELLQKLEKLKDQIWQGKENFLRAIENAISQEQTQKWRDTLLTSSVELEWIDRNNQRSRTETLRDLFAVFYKIFSDSKPATEWPADVLEPFVQLVIDWFEFLLKSRTTWAGFTPIIEEAVKNFAPGASTMKEKILRRMLDEKAGIGCVADEKEVDQPGLIFSVWSSLLEACTKENPVHFDSKIVYEQIWHQQVREIISRINLNQYAESAFSKSLRKLCHQLNDFYIEKERNKTLFYEMWRTIENKQFEETARLFFLEFYANNEFSTTDYRFIFDNYTSRLQAFIERIMRALMEGRSQHLEIDYRYHEERVFKFVRQLSFLAKQPHRFESRAHGEEIQNLVRDNFVFTGKYSALRPEQHFRFWKIVEDAVATGLENNRSYLAFTDEIFIQAELLMNLNLLENRDYRRLRVDGFFFVLETPQFVSRFGNLKSEAKETFYDNLYGFIDAAKNIPTLKRSILPAVWSYLRRAPKGNDSDVDRCFEKMMHFVENNTSNRGWFKSAFPELCKEIEDIPCNSRSKHLTFFDSPSEKIYIRKCDDENYLMQLAIATQDRPERIAIFLNTLVRIMGLPEVDGRIQAWLHKFYLPSVSDFFDNLLFRKKKQAWIDQFEDLAKR